MENSKPTAIETTAGVKVQAPEAAVNAGDLIPRKERFALVPTTIAEAIEFSKIIARSGMVPKSYEDKSGIVSWEKVLIAVQMGQELGLKPMQAIQNIAVINGQPSIWGDAIVALISTQPDFVDMIEVIEDARCTCTMKRKDREDVTRSFGVADEKVAGLEGKDTYRKYGKRMRQMRARGWAARDMWADVLKGMGIIEETAFIERDITPEAEKTHQTKVEGVAARVAEVAGRAAAIVAQDSAEITDAVMVEPTKESQPGGSTNEQHDWDTEISQIVDAIGAVKSYAELNSSEILQRINKVPDDKREPIRSAYGAAVKTFRAAQGVSE